MTGETTTETPREAERAETPTRSTATPVAVWIVYALGLLAAFVFVVSLAFVGIAYATTTGDGGFGLDVSTTSFVVWLLLAVAAVVTFIWRRFGAGR